MSHIQKLFFLCFLLFCLLPQGATAHDILLDPGHSPQKSGAESCTGLQEVWYNDTLVATIRHYLLERGIKVDVTRTPTMELSLQKRAAKAHGKRLFVSIHHDSAQPRYITLVQGHPVSQKVHGYALFVSKKNAFFEASLLYARILGEILRSHGLTPSTHHGEPIQGENRPLLDARLGIYQFDDLVVLKNAPAPALLLEAAVIINPHDEAMARTKAFQLKIADALAQTIRFVQANR